MFEPQKYLKALIEKCFRMVKRMSSLGKNKMGWIMNVQMRENGKLVS